MRKLSETIFASEVPVLTRNTCTVFYSYTRRMILLNILINQNISLVETAHDRRDCD